MIIYEFGTAEAVRALTACRPESLEQTERFAGTPVDGEWQAPEVEYIRDGSAGDRRADILTYGTVPAFTPKAIEALGDVLTQHGQLLPLRSRDGEFYAYNVTTVVDALDEQRSEGPRFSTGRFIWLDRYEFLPERVASYPIFKLPQFPRGRWYYTDAFLNRVREAELIGLAPRQIWTDAGERDV